MCGIIGVFRNSDAAALVKKGLKLLNRGSDSFGIATDRIITADSIAKLRPNRAENAIGHSLLSVVGRVSQPLKQKGVLAANCEIYNWQELAKKHKIKAENDAELLLKLIEQTGKVCDAVKGLDGDYAFCYYKDDLVLTRDIIGIKPLFYSHNNGFSFCSEKKVLEKLGFTDIQELNPRKHLTYEPENDRIYFTNRDFFDILPNNNAKQLKEKLIDAVKKRIPNRKLGLLFSGGVDSSLLALILKKLGADFTCYTAALDEPGMSQAQDLEYAQKVAAALDLKLKIRKLRIKEIPAYLEKIIPIIEDTNVTKVGVALTFFPACELAKLDDTRVILSGLGSEEIFAGYQRHKQALDINKECLYGLLKMYERDTFRDDTITMHNNLELRVPYLDLDLIRYSLKIPAKMKIKDGMEKAVLREIALDMGLPKEFAHRKKKAAQYGSKMNRALEKLSKRNGFKLKSDYLRQFYHNLNLAALVSGGKDSIYAMHLMQKQNYKIGCLVTLRSKNPDSYMFHTPAIDMVKLQAEAMELPLLTYKTEGVKEKELEDLREALKLAKDKFKVDGIITGALYSIYQRDRIERICDELSLKVFSPLWHINQETEMKEILDSGIEFIMTAVAAEGLDKTWLGKSITYKDITKLARLNKKIGLNIAGEGGEFESLVINAPFFKKRIELEYDVRADKNSARILVTKARIK